MEEARKAEEVLRKPKKDSKTSSQPPSQDEKAKITKASGWGAKPGHQGFSYQPLPHDKVRIVPITTCPYTGTDLSQQPVVNYITHQVVGIECKRVVTNYELEVRYSPAYGGLVSAPLPNGGKHYDNSIRSLATYLNTMHHIPQGRCRQILQDLFSVAPSKGTINNILIRPVVVHRKVIQCFRTGHGAQAFATWYSLIHTFRKQGINVFEALKAIFDGITPKINFPQLE